MIRRQSKAAPPIPAAAVRLLGNTSDPEIAEQFGLTIYRVKLERGARGIPPCEGGRKPSADGHREVPRTIWLTSAQEAAIDAARGELSFSAYVARAALAAAGRTRRRQPAGRRHPDRTAHLIPAPAGPFVRSAPRRSSTRGPRPRAKGF